MEEIRIMAPGRGRCPECAAQHKPDEPHDRRSLYYQYRFHKEHGHFPTREDAMRHCVVTAQGRR